MTQTRAPTPLELEIRARIATDGPMPVSRYMELCLGHPRHGYYITRDPLGRAGDFTTAPEISQMFGELIGLWAVAAWQAMGSPTAFVLMELGPGRGTLMEDALRAARLVPAFGAAARVHLVETSPVLRQSQAHRLKASCAELTWHTDITQVPEGPTVVLANEFFDALPIAQFVRAGAHWHERCVGIGPDGALAFGLNPTPSSAATRFARHFEGSALPGAVLEHLDSAAGDILARRLAAAPGFALVIDYGPARSGFGDTLQAVAGHRFVDALATPGAADLTAHVDFAALARTAQRAGAAAFGPLTQADFLERLGLSARAERLKRDATPPQREDIEAARVRLCGGGAGEMGNLFKVLSLATPGLGVPPAFDPCEHFRDLP